MNDTATDNPPAKRGRRFALHVLWGMAALIFAVAVALTLIIGTQLSAPEWLRNKITEKINNDISGFSVNVADMSVVIEDDWVPRLSLRNVVLRDAGGGPLLNLTDVQTTLALQPLLRGELRPGSVRLSGARVTLRRAADGVVGVAVGDKVPTVEEADDFISLIKKMDGFLQQSHYASLKIAKAVNVTLRYEDARTGRAWTVDGGRLSLTREGDNLRIRGNFVLLGARDYATTLEMNYTSRIGETDAEIGVSFQDMPSRDIAGQSPALAWLEALDAPISGAMRAHLDSTGTLGVLNATLQIGEGVLQPTTATKPIAFSSVRSYFNYDPVKQVIEFDELVLNSKWVNVAAEGRAYLVDIENGWPSQILGQISMREIVANPDDVYPEPIQFDAATMDIRLRMDPFELSLGEMILIDQGQRLILDGELQAKTEGWNLALNGRMDGLAPDRLLQLWPVSLEGNVRKWIVENVRKADLKNIQLAVRSKPKHRADVFLGFDFEELETQFVKDVPPIEHATGHASLYDGRFVITADTGYVTAAQGGRIDISGTSFLIPDVRIKRGPAQALLRTSSTITAALSLLDEKPFRFLQKAGQPVTLADGRAKLAGTLDFLLKPKLTPEEVAFDVTGQLTDVRSETLAEGRVLAAAELKVHAKSGSLEIGGSGRIGQVPFQGRWMSRLGKEAQGKSTITGWVELSERFADEFRIGLPKGSISGAGRATIAIDFERGTPGQFQLSSDLEGVGLSLRQLNWSLGQGTPGRLEVSGKLGQPPEIDRVLLDAAGLKAEGSVQLHDDGHLNRASFANVRAGSWLNAPVELVGRGAGATPAIVVAGGTIDMRQTSVGGGLPGSAAQQAQGGPVTLALDRLQISEGISLTDFRADLNMANGVDGTFSGRVNGGSAVTGRVVPQKGRSAFRIRSNDAGGVMRSAGLLKSARSGDMELILTPAEKPGTFNGSLTAQRLRLKDAPALAALLNAMSVIGLLEQMAGDGIHFNAVEARFRLTPNRVTLFSSSAVGASMGISMDGYYYMQNGQMDLQGVVSPLYVVNAVGGLFTRRGEGLIGFNYKLTGTAQQPRVSVNPLSALTPGMFRELFRRSPPVDRERQPEITVQPNVEPTAPVERPSR